jgi:hypothetical protein
MKNPDVSLGIDIRPDELSPVASIHGCGKSRPVLDQAIRIGEVGLTGVLSLLSACRESKCSDRQENGEWIEFRSTQESHQDTSHSKNLPATK